MTGLEWEDPLHVNILNDTETRKLNLIITRIAVLINKRKIVLRPYFQDYELVHSGKIHLQITILYYDTLLRYHTCNLFCI